MYKCLIVDDHAAIRAGVKAIIEGDHISVVAEAVNGKEAIILASELELDVILMDIRMPGMDGFEATRRILKQRPRMPVVLYSAHTDRLIADGMGCGARGYVLKDAPADEIVQALQTVAAGGSYVDKALAAQLVVTKRPTALSPREAEVLRLLADGFTNPRIAQRLFISPETVRTHIQHAMSKLDAETRTQAVALALHHGFI